MTLPHLNEGDFRKDTGRYAAVGLYMWSGGSLSEPYLNPTTPYFNKPPLALWIHGWFLSTFGRSLAAARLPSILAALLVVCCTVLLAREVGSKTEGITSGLVLALTHEFFRRTREISLDMWQLAFVLLAAWIAVRGAHRDKALWVVMAGVPLALALLCKPLVAFVLLPMLVCWWLVLGKGRMTLVLLFGMFPVTLLVALPWHWHMWRTFGTAFSDQYLFHEVVNRALGRLQTNPPTYYFAGLVKHYWPWLPVAIFAIGQWFWKAERRGTGRSLVLFGGFWTMIWLCLLTLFPDKKINYALPIYPGLAWIAAAGLCRMPWRQLRTWYQSGFPGLAPAAVGGLALAAVIPFRYQAEIDPDWQAFLHWMDRNRVRPGELGYTGLDLNQICYFYIRKGWWPSPAAAIGTAVSSPKYLLSKTADVAGTNALFKIQFDAPKLKVFAAPPDPDQLFDAPLRNEH